MDSGEPRFVSNPPLLEPAAEVLGDHRPCNPWSTGSSGSFRQYRHSLPSDRRLLLERYEFVDLARKVVGVGSVGTRCWVALLIGRKDGTRSSCRSRRPNPRCSSPICHSPFAQHGQPGRGGPRSSNRPATSSSAGNASPASTGRPRLLLPPALGLEELGRRRHLPPALLAVYGKVCGYTMARAHARSGDTVALRISRQRQGSRPVHRPVRAELRRPEQARPRRLRGATGSERLLIRQSVGARSGDAPRIVRVRRVQRT